MRHLLFLLVLLTAPVEAQHGKPFDKGDVRVGQTMVEKDCNGCHVRRFGDPQAAYTRIDRKVNTAAQLHAQIAYCNTQLGTGYFPDEEEHIAAYLNLTYYKFGP
jgi:hypothetical protein